MINSLEVIRVPSSSCIVRGMISVRVKVIPLLKTCRFSLTSVSTKHTVYLAPKALYDPFFCLLNIGGQRFDSGFFQAMDEKHSGLVNVGRERA